MADAGACKLCGKALFEVLQRVPRDRGALAGTPLRLGRPLAGARRLTFVLASGRIAEMSFCKDCKPKPGDLPTIWSICLQNAALECDNAHRAQCREVDLNLPDLNETQQWHHLRNWLVLRNDVPLGIIAAQDWEDLHGRS